MILTYGWILYREEIISSALSVGKAARKSKKRTALRKEPPRAGETSKTQPSRPFIRRRGRRQVAARRDNGRGSFATRRSASSRHEKRLPKEPLILSCRRTIRTVPTRTDGFGLRQLLWLSDSTYPLLSKYFHPLFCRTSRRSRARLIFVVNRALIKVSFQNIRLSFNKSFCLIKQF